MAKQNFLLLNLQEEKAKKIAQAISNESCRKILDYLAENDSSESDIAKKLGLPISTVHYNLQQLLETNLVTVEEFHYSKKGKEINHYKLANKYVIIAPKSTFGIKERLKTILPVIGITLFSAGLLQYLTNPNIADVPDEISAKAPAAMLRAADSAPAVIGQSVSTPNIALWFLGGALVCLLSYLAIDYYMNKKRYK